MRPPWECSAAYIAMGVQRPMRARYARHRPGNGGKNDPPSCGGGIARGGEGNL